MKKLVLPVFSLAVLLSMTVPAQAQVGAAIGFGRMIARKNSDKAAKAANTIAVGTGSYQGKEFPMYRTPADKLPAKGAEELTTLENELDRCHIALLADATSPICTPEQRKALQTAIVKVVQAKAGGNMTAYQQEASFYLAEDARRQQVAPTAPTN